MFKALDHSSFLHAIPKYLNNRETVSNIKLIKMVIMLSFKKLLSFKIMREGINAFTLMERDLQQTNLPVDEDVIYKTLMLVGMTMSPNLIKMWLKRVRPHLECE